MEHCIGANCAVLWCILSNVRTSMTPAQICFYSATMWHCVWLVLHMPRCCWGGTMFGWYYIYPMMGMTFLNQFWLRLNYLRAKDNFRSILQVSTTQLSQLIRSKHFKSFIKTMSYWKQTGVNPHEEGGSTTDGGVAGLYCNTSWWFLR